MSRYAITIGDPAGIGPEIILKALNRLDRSEQETWTLYADPWVMEDWATRLGLPRPISPYSPLGFPPTPLPALFEDTRRSAEIAWASLKAASGDLNARKKTAVVTAPISKARMQAVGFPYPGHTEFFAAESKSDPVRMMFVAPSLKVVLDSIHLPLRQVAERLSADHLQKTFEITRTTLETQFGIISPKLAVCGLNPHAGEAGMLGREECDIIAPLLAEMPDIAGPFASDAYFAQKTYAHYDATICLYHDQGLIPFKMLHAHDGVNFTAGLPYVRTSPDHGPAFDIAGKNTANDGSFFAALQLIEALTKGRRGEAPSRR